MTPVETPDHFGSGNSDGRAIDDDRCADIDIDHRRRWDEDRRFRASDFVTAVLAIEFHVAVERARDALVLRLALEFVVAARGSWRAWLAVELVGIVSAIVVAIASPVLQHASLVGALIFVRLTTQQTASHFVRLVGAVEISVANRVLRDAFAVHARGLVDSASRWRPCGRLGKRFNFEIDGHSGAWSRCRVADSFANVRSSVFRLNVGHFQASIVVASGRRQSQPAATSPAHWRSGRAFVTALEHHLTTLENSLIGRVSFQIEFVVSGWAFGLVGKVLTVPTTVAHQTVGHALIATGTAEFTIFALNTAVALVTSVGTIDGPVASSVTFDALAAIAAELVRPAVAIFFVGFVGAIVTGVATSTRIQASPVSASELVFRANWRGRCGTIDFIVTIRTVDDAVAFLIGRDTETTGRAAELIGQTRSAVDLVGSVTAVTVSIAFSPDVDASAVRAAEFVAGAFFEAVGLVRLVGWAVHFAIASQFAVDARAKIALPLVLGAQASNFVATISAVVSSVATLSNGDAGLVAFALELARLARFGSKWTVFFVFLVGTVGILVAYLFVGDALVVATLEFATLTFNDGTIAFIPSIQTIGTAIAKDGKGKASAIATELVLRATSW